MTGFMSNSYPTPGGGGLKCKIYVDPCTGLWIRIHFMRILIQLFISMQIRIQQLFKRIRIQSNKICSKLLHEEFKKTKKFSKVKNNGACPHLLNFLKIKLQFLPISVNFFLFFPPEIFPSWILIWIRIY